MLILNTDHLNLHTEKMERGWPISSSASNKQSSSFNQRHSLSPFFIIQRRMSWEKIGPRGFNSKVLLQLGEGLKSDTYSRSDVIIS